MEDSIKFENNVAFAIGTGRCGTKFISELLKTSSEVASCHERAALNDTFHRYLKWYNIPADNEGFLFCKELEILKDLKEKKLSFEASAYLSFSIIELYKRFNAKFVFMIREPAGVVKSYLKKGYYLGEYKRMNPDLAPTFQYHNDMFHHFLGRIVPCGREYLEWNKLTRTGKIAWYWSAVNRRIYEQLKDIPKENWILQKLEDFNYDSYLKISDFLNVKADISEKKFDKLVKKRPNKMNSNLFEKNDSWDEIEKKEFIEQVSKIAEQYGYEIK